MPEIPGGSMQETFNSLIRLSAALTVFSVQQVQTVVGSGNPKESVDKVREVFDGMAAAISANIDESRLATLDSISNLGNDVVDRTTGIVKTTSDWLYEMVKAKDSASPGSR